MIESTEELAIKFSVGETKRQYFKSVLPQLFLCVWSMASVILQTLLNQDVRREEEL